MTHLAGISCAALYPLSVPPGSDINLLVSVDEKKALENPAVSSFGLEELKKNQVRVFKEEEIKDRVEIGHGAFGTVWKAYWLGATIAIKKLNNVEDFEQEKNQMASLQHPNIAKFYGTIENNATSFVMEYMEKGDLAKLIQDKKIRPWDWKTRILIFKDIARGLKYLHDLNIIHRDIKSPNVLITSDLHAKISDLGIAKLIETSTVTGAGTFAWMAPEILKSEKYGRSVDVYSLGLIFWELAEEKTPPFGSYTMPQIFDLSRAGKKEESFSDNVLPPRLKEIIQQCWNNRPQDRPLAKQVLERLDQISEAEMSHFARDMDIFKACQTGALGFVKQEVEKCRFWQVSELTNKKDSEGSPLLNQAALNGQSLVVEYLLANRADPKLIDAEDYQPLHSAAKSGDVVSAKHLLKQGVSLEVRGGKGIQGELYGRTPLHRAVYNGKQEMVRLLLESGADVNARTFEADSQKTALHDAAAQENLPILLELLSHPKIDVNIPNSLGWTALRLCVEGGHLQGVAAIVRHHTWKPMTDPANPNHEDELIKLAGKYPKVKNFLEILFGKNVD